MNRRGELVFRYLLTGIFLLILILPGIQMFFGLFGTVTLAENRTRATFPVFSAAAVNSGAFMSNFEKYFNDHFGFRDRLIMANNWIESNIFHQSSNPKVILGKNGYMYYFDEVNDYHKISTMTDAQIAEIGQKLEDLKNHLGRHGIGFLFFIGPNKSTIYPEFMAGRRKNPNGKTNYDRLCRELQRRKIDYLDTTSLLIGLKRKYNLYYKTDTHWNNIATLFVARKILEHYRIPQASLPRINGFVTQKHLGDLSILLGEQTAEDAPFPQVTYGAIRDPIPKTLWIYDSFTTPIIPYIKPYFSDIDFQNINGISSNPLNFHHVKFVIMERVEREIPNLLYTNIDYDKDFDDKLLSGYKSLGLNLAKPDHLYQEVVTLEKNKAYRLSSTGEDPQILWKFATPRRINYCLLEFDEPPRDSLGQIFWSTVSDPQLDERKSMCFLLSPLKTKYVVRLKDADQVKCFRVDIGTQANQMFILKKITLFERP